MNRRIFLKGITVGAAGVTLSSIFANEEENEMFQDSELEKLNKGYQALIESFPQRVPLDTKIIYRRKMYGYEEWKIEYTAEGEDTMSEPSVRRIPAYLLVPTDYRDEAVLTGGLVQEDRQPPFPAMICFHQCNIDCTLGKEAVVGKVINRPDQAYGFELVQQGFVVLAPDTINCGERNIPAIRKEGENISRSSCLSQFQKRIGQPFESKMMFDGTRAVDLLQSLDFVDSDRIGAIGHSLGAGTTLSAMLADSRIKAGIISGGWGGKEIALIAPRLFMGLWGTHDAGPKGIKGAKGAYEFAQKIYGEKGVPENLILRTPPCGHHFLDQFKWEAYYKLKQYFGMAEVKESISLKDVLMSAQERAWRFWMRNDKDGASAIPDECYVIANKEMLTRAFSSLFRFIRGRCPLTSSVNVYVESDQDNLNVVCAIIGVESPVESLKGSSDHTIRDAEQLFVENSASLRRESTTDQVKYIVALQKAN